MTRCSTFFCFIGFCAFFCLFVCLFLTSFCYVSFSFSIPRKKQKKKKKLSLLLRACLLFFFAHFHSYDSRYPHSHGTSAKNVVHHFCMCV